MATRGIGGFDIFNDQFGKSVRLRLHISCARYPLPIQLHLPGVVLFQQGREFSYAFGKVAASGGEAGDNLLDVLDCRLHLLSVPSVEEFSHVVGVRILNDFHHPAYLNLPRLTRGQAEFIITRAPMTHCRPVNISRKFKHSGGVFLSPSLGLD